MEMKYQIKLSFAENVEIRSWQKHRNFSYKEHVASENQNSEKQGMKPKKIIGIVAILIIAGTSALLSGIFKTKNMEKNEAIISCGIEGSNSQVYEYNGELKI